MPAPRSPSSAALALAALLAGAPAAGAQQLSGPPALAVGGGGGALVPPLAWSRQLHQNVGGQCAGHNLCWGDQDPVFYADHLIAQTRDPSILAGILVGSGTIGGATVAGDQVGVQWTIGATTYSHYLTAQAGETTTALAKDLAAYINGGAVSATVASQGAGGYTDGDTVSLVIPSAADCPFTPQFQLTVSGGTVTGLTRLAVRGSGIEGGACITPPSDPVAVTGGTGSGLTLDVSWGWTDITAALAGFTDKNGIGSTPTAGYQTSFNGGTGDWVRFDMPAGTTLLVCPGTGVSCPATQITPLALSDAHEDNGPYLALNRTIDGRDPVRGDEVGNLRFVGQSSGGARFDTRYGQIGASVGAVTAATATSAVAGGTSCPCTVTVSGYAGSLPGLPSGAIATTNYRLRDSTHNQALLSGSYITDITANGADTDITFAGTLGGGGIAIGDLMSIIDTDQPVGRLELDAAVAGSAGAAATQLYCGGYNGGCWTPGVSGNTHGDGSQGTDTLNLLGLYDNGTAPTGTAGSGYVRAAGATLTGPTIGGAVPQATFTANSALDTKILLNGASTGRNVYLQFQDGATDVFQVIKANNNHFKLYDNVNSSAALDLNPAGNLSLGENHQISISRTGATTVTSGLALTPVALTDAATIAVNASLGNNFTLTLGGNRVLANPTNLVPGQVLRFAVSQDATGGRTLAYGSFYKWPGGAAPTLTAAANAKDVIRCWADTATTLECTASLDLQ